MDFLNDARKKLNLTTNPNITLIIGNTDCGKTTSLNYVNDVSDEQSAIESINSNSNNLQLGEKLINDTRDKTVEITSTFLTKTIIERATNIKIDLILDYDAVIEGQNSTKFDNLLSRTVRLIKNIKQFEDSISLIVTKVDRSEMRHDCVENELGNSLKNSMAQFMIVHRSVLRQNGSNERKIALINALLKRSSDDYPRILILWLGNGTYVSFNAIQKMMAAERRCKHQHTNFAEMHKNDFSFPLTAEAE